MKEFFLGKIQNPPKTVSFKRYKLEGTVIDEVRSPEFDGPNVDFMNVIQLIKFKDRREIRFGYYIREHGGDENSWTWGSQTTLTMEENRLKKFFRTALKKDWFKNLFNEF